MISDTFVKFCRDAVEGLIPQLRTAWTDFGYLKIGPGISLSAMDDELRKFFFGLLKRRECQIRRNRQNYSWEIRRL